MAMSFSLFSGFFFGGVVARPVAAFFASLVLMSGYAVYSGDTVVAEAEVVEAPFVEAAIDEYEAE